jgi:predicted small secreted protein
VGLVSAELSDLFHARWADAGSSADQQPKEATMPWKNLVLRIVTLAIAGIGATQLVACNTTEGAGRDIERAGEKIQDVADDAKN